MDAHQQHSTISHLFIPRGPPVDPLWTPCGPPVDPLWTPRGPPVDSTRAETA